MSDSLSGGSSLEVWRGDPDKGQLVPGFPDTTDFQGVRRYNVGPLEEGRYTVRGFDSAGNDSRGSFVVLQPPQLTIQALSSTRTLYEDFQGTAPVSRSAIAEYHTSTMSMVAVWISSGALGSDPRVTELTLRGPGGRIDTIADPVSGPGPEVAYFFRDLGLGTYTFTAVNAAGMTTVAPFTVERLEMALCPGARSSFDGAVSFTALHPVLCASSSLGLKLFAERQILTTELLGPPKPLAGNAAELDLGGDLTSGPLPSDGVQRVFVLRDVESNGVEFMLGLGNTTHEPAYPIPGPGLKTFATPTLELPRSDDLYGLYGALLPGARIGLKAVDNAGVTAYVPNPGVNLELVPGTTTGDLPIGPVQIIGRLTVTVKSSSGPDPSAAEPQELFNQDVTADFTSSTFSVPGARPGVLERYFQVTAQITPKAPSAVTAGNCLEYAPDSGGTRCRRWKQPDPYLQAVAPEVVGQRADTKINYSPGAYLLGGESGLDLPLGLGFNLKAPSVTQGGRLSLWLAGRQVPLRWVSLPDKAGYRLNSGGAQLAGAGTVEIFYQPAGLSPAQALGINILFSSTPLQTPDLRPLSVEVSTPMRRVTGTFDYWPMTGTGASGDADFVVVAPRHASPSVRVDGELLVQSDDPGVTVERVQEGSLGFVLGFLSGRGYQPVTGVYELGPEGAVFGNPAVVQFTYSPERLAAMNIAPHDLKILQFKRDGSLIEEFPVQQIDQTNRTISVLVSRFSSLFAVLGATTPVPVDLQAPVTRIGFQGDFLIGADGKAYLSTSSRVNLSAEDPPAPGFASSGVSGTFYLLDQVFVDSQTTPVAEFSFPFYLSPGTHTVAFFSVDQAGNVEAPKSAIVIVSSISSGGGGLPPPAGETPGRGLALAADSSGGLWMVIQDTSSIISLAKFNSTGAFQGGVHLPGAGEFGAWRIGFDEQGNAVAVGSSMGQTTGPDLAVYRASPQGVLLSTAAFDAGLGAADIAMDASGDLWIAGAVQTGGQSEADIQGQMALWRYTPQDGLKLKSLYAGPGGLDAGFGVRVDGSGNVWVVGFSSNPATPGANKLDLALWKYESTGSSLTAGPFRKPSYARGIGETTNAKLVIENGAVFLAAGKLNSAGDMDLAIAKHDLSGAEIWSRNWHSDPVGDEVPSAILSSNQGLSIAGGVFRGQDRPLAVWRYSLDGTFFSAETSAGVGKANDMASNAEGTWLAVDGRGSPYKFTGGTVLPGSGDGQAPQDTLPPRTTIVVGEPKSGTDTIVIATFTSLGFAAVDDLTQVGDGVGSGVRETLYLIDADPQACEGVVQVSTAPRGACANPVYSSSFTLTAGTHTITYFSRDNAGNEEPAKQANFTVNLVFFGPTDNKPPRTTLGIGAPQFGSAPLFIATHTPLSLSAVDDLTQVGDGLGSGVSQTLFLIDVSPESCEGVSQSTSAPRGTCANSVYGSTFTLGPGTHTITFLSRDFIGNEEAPQIRNLTADGTPPVTKALVNGQSVASEMLTSTDSISFSAVDAGSGVRETFFERDGAPSSSATESFSLAAGTHSLVFFSIDNLDNLEAPQSANLTVVPADATAPVLVLAPTTGSTVTVARPLIRADYSDLGRGIDITSVRLELDGVDLSTQAVVTASSAAFTPSADLSQGTHTAGAWVRDLAGNKTRVLSRFFVDSLAPETKLQVNGVENGTGNLVLITTDTISFSAEDSGTGVRETRYSLDGAPEQVFTTAFTLAAGTHTLAFRSQDNAGNLETARLVNAGVTGPDTTAPTSFLEIGQPKFGTAPLYVSTATLFGLTASEPATISYAIDAGVFQVFAASFTLGQGGERTISWRAMNMAGNSEALRTISVFVDSTPPVTTLFVNGALAAGASLNLAPGDQLSLSAADEASGLRELRHSLDGAAFGVYAGSLTLAPGLHSLRFRGQDNVLNQELERAVGITVSVPGGDTTSPSLNLSCPGAETGVCSVFKERFSVRGRVLDENLAWYRLESGTALISSGTENRDGTFGVWDVSGLAGVQELKLTGEDLAGNTATLTRQVFIGEPARLLVIASKKDMGQPQGVAVDNARGVVYVANTNKGEIRLYSLYGAYIKKYEDYRHPRAVAVDEGGNLYIAESGKDRIVKLGPSGNVLWKRGKSGRGAMEFRDPSGIAALGGKVVVADTRNRRVQILDGDGNFQQEFPIPEGSETLGQDDGDQDDEPENRKGVPVGIALDGQGRIFVADAKNRKGLAFSPSGEKLSEFGGPEIFARPEGIAVSTSGECVFISDRIKDKITKFNGVGERNLAFGNQGNIKKDRPLPVETVFRRPAGLHLDTVGTLWIADRNNEAVQRFGLPGTLTAGTAGAFRVTEEDDDQNEESGQATPARFVAEFLLREAYAIPNPCKGCGSQGFVVQVGLGDSVNLECRNAMGRVVYHNAFPIPALKDIGNGRGPQYTYEQHWPLSGIGTGVYACMMTARKAGKPEIRKVIRTAIIR